MDVASGMMTRAVGGQTALWGIRFIYYIDKPWLGPKALTNSVWACILFLSGCLLAPAPFTRLSAERFRPAVDGGFANVAKQR
jgi:hypothetical protein